MEKIKTVKLAAKHIRIDGGTQPRVELNEAIVQEYSEAMKAGAEFPPCVVFYDGSNNWLADGYHRYFGAAKAGTSLLCEQHSGSRRDAILYSVGANSTHGLRRTNADKRRAIETLLADEEWSARSDNWIAETCRVSAHTVAELRKSTMQMQSQTVRQTSDGRTINTANIGKTAAAPEPTAEYFTDGEAPDDEPILDEDDDTGLSATEIETGGLQHRARNAAVVYDTMAPTPEPESEPEPEIDENDLTDEEWLMSLPLFALQVSRGNKMLLMRADALAWRSMQIKGAWGAFKHAADRSFNFKAAATPLADLAYQLTKVPHPRDWHGCAKCRANGCSDCRHTGYDLHVGLTVEQLEARR